MMAAPQFHVGQKVLLRGKLCLIVAIEKPDNGMSGIFNMGRYKVRYYGYGDRRSGDTLSNAPGYLMKVVDDHSS